ncbi:hypothetical protein OPV22_010122 [Ensete ventricosum]|uniref:Uncharacterized protein n=1 Tax=Ensete ventricosum TaxID=4639 RepID=A0AAV8PTG7_ENSVE|nr:hypothetical protein OPV22_010122 [Ensete ventricosum]
MMKSHRGKSAARKPLGNISNGRNPLRSRKKGNPKDGNEGAFDRLLLVRSQGRERRRLQAPEGMIVSNCTLSVIEGGTRCCILLLSYCRDTGNSYARDLEPML